MSAADQQLEASAREVFFLLQELLRTYQFRDVGAICSFGVSLTECHLLDLLAPGEGQSVKDLAARLGLDKSTTSRAIDTLIEKKLVRKKTSSSDARAVRVELTAAGRKRHEAIVAGSVACYVQLLAALPAEDRREMVNGFRKLVSLLGQRSPTC
jgi:MarR family transcriptional regulator, 2-MHQ and catechol-resistance regulon repressor